MVLAVVLVVGALLPGAAQALEPQRWALQDQEGHAWSLTLLEQVDPAYPGGWRLRLTDHSGSQRLDHSRPLRLHDGTEGSWELVNCSGELVPAGVAELPTSSAQFDLVGLDPRPRAELPLVLEVPVDSGAVAQLIAGAGAVAALHSDPGF